jgi:alpha-galactosidase
MKIAIIGAGSAQFSGGIIRDLCVTPSLHGAKLTLMDINETRLGFITKMGKKLTAELGAQLEFEAVTDRRAALEGADFVINTAQDQGHAWFEAQRRIGEKHGYYRCGMIGMLYQTAFLLDVAKDVEKYCPNAWLIQSSNPVFEGCTIIHRKTHAKAIGLCHGHYGYRDIAKTLGLEFECVSAKMYGFNHWIWMSEFRYKGENAYPLIDRWIEEKSADYWKLPRKYSDQQMSPAAIHQYRLLGLMPIGDTPRMMDYPSMLGWLYNNSLEWKKRWYSQQGGFDSAEGWAQYLDDLNRNLRDIEKAATDDTMKVTDVFKPVQSDEQIVPIIESLTFDKPRVFQVNIPNRGALVEGFPQDIVVECEALVSGAGVQGIHMGRLPSRVIAGAMNPRYAQCELVCEAIGTGSREAFRLVFLMDHDTRSLEQVDAMLDEWIADPRCESIRKILQ